MHCGEAAPSAPGIPGPSAGPVLTPEVALGVFWTACRCHLLALKGAGLGGGFMGLGRPQPREEVGFQDLLPPASAPASRALFHQERAGGTKAL